MTVLTGNSRGWCGRCRGFGSTGTRWSLRCRTTLVEYLRCQRLTLEMMCSGLDAADLARRSVEPSTMSMLGLVRHLAEVERSWSRRVMAGQDALKHFCSEATPDGDFGGVVPDPEIVAEAWQVWRAECASTDRFVAEAPDLGVTDPDQCISLREVVVHLVEEYAPQRPRRPVA